MSATNADVLGDVRDTVAEMITDLRASGTPVKLVWEAVARRFGCMTPRRVKALSYGEVSADDIRAREWLAAVEIRNQRRQARIAAARALLAQEDAQDA